MHPLISPRVCHVRVHSHSSSVTMLSYKSYMYCKIYCLRMLTLRLWPCVTASTKCIRHFGRLRKQNLMTQRQHRGLNLRLAIFFLWSHFPECTGHNKNVSVSCHRRRTALLLDNSSADRGKARCTCVLAVMGLITPSHEVVGWNTPHTGFIVDNIYLP